MTKANGNNGNKKKKILLWILLAVIAVAMLYEWCAARQNAPSAELPSQAAQNTAAQDAAADGSEAEAAEDDGLLTLLPEDDDGAEEAQPDAAVSAEEENVGAAQAIAEDGTYTTKDDVALYLYTYGRLPQNFIRKSEAQSLGWSGGGLDDYAYGKSIGGDRFGNYEGNLPEKNGRKYYECDIGTMHKSSRGAKRIVFSNDGLIYYTDDHYESFTLLYGEE